MTHPTAENVLFVVLDTVRKDRLTPYGASRDTSPGLAALADDPATTTFEEAVAPAPWTLPVHASLFTGLYPSGHGADQENPYLEGVTTLAETLSAAGYDTACYSSNAWITPYTRLTDGFDDQDNFFQVMPGDLLSGPLARAWRALNDDERLRAVADRLVSLGNTAHEYLAGGDGADSKTPAALERTREFVAESDGEGWFAFVNLMDAHLPYHPPEEYAERFAPGVDSTAVCQNSKEYNCGARAIDDDEWADIRGLYDAEIAHMDAELSRLFDWLRDRGEWEDTLVVVCADHGELHGEHDLYGHEFCLYDPLVNVPLLVNGPGVAADPEETVELLDLYHTVLDALDVEGGDPLTPGDEAVARDPRRSLLSGDYRAFPGAVDAETPADDPGMRAGGDYGFVEYARPVVELKQLEEKASAAGVALDEDSRFYARMRAARGPSAKYVRVDRTPDEAFRLGEDPGETTNRAAGDDDPALRRAERALAAFEGASGGAWTTADDADVSDDAVDEFDAETQERLRDLGYLE
jgi:arylsulfatase A-like enzyme